MGYCVIFFYILIVISAYCTWMVNFTPVLISVDTLLGIFLTLVFHVLALFQVFPYIACVLRSPGTPPTEWIGACRSTARDALEASARSAILEPGPGQPVRAQLTSVESDEEEEVSLGRVEAGLFTQCDLSNVGWCTKCQQPKPDRCHHCHICDQCILKMDHHCPWVSNCLGFRNYKYFVQMLVYSVIVCLYYAIVGFCTLFHTPVNLSTQMVNLMMTILVLALGLGAFFLMCSHLYFLASNKTTLECDSLGKSVYDLGSIKANVEAVMGRPMWRWFWVFSPPPLEGGGTSFKRSDSPSSSGPRTIHLHPQFVASLGPLMPPPLLSASSLPPLPSEVVPAEPTLDSNV